MNCKEFLKQRGALEEFISNCESQRVNWYFEDMKREMEDDFVEDAISCAFPWILSPQGDSYWGLLSLEWEQICLEGQK